MKLRRGGNTQRNTTTPVTRDRLVFSAAPLIIPCARTGLTKMPILLRSTRRRLLRAIVARDEGAVLNVLLLHASNKLLRTIRVDNRPVWQALYERNMLGPEHIPLVSFSPRSSSGERALGYFVARGDELAVEAIVQEYKALVFDPYSHSEIERLLFQRVDRKKWRHAWSQYCELCRSPEHQSLAPIRKARLV